MACKENYDNMRWAIHTLKAAIGAIDERIAAAQSGDLDASDPRVHRFGVAHHWISHLFAEAINQINTPTDCIDFHAVCSVQHNGMAHAAVIFAVGVALAGPHNGWFLVVVVGGGHCDTCWGLAADRLVKYMQSSTTWSTHL